MKNGSQKKRVISLIYHDVVKREDHQQSGFPTPDAAIYKLDPDLFKQHLAAIAGAVSSRPILVTELESNNEGNEGSEHPWMITFDDGGASSHHPIADLLESAGWRGHFFITTDYIGKPGFMSREEVRDLHRRGHKVGTHSCSHPLRFASRPLEEMKREWGESARVLSEILGEPVRIASLPGGQYSRQVAQSAVASGIRIMFTSEPIARTDYVDGCLVIGRYSIQRWMPPAVAAGMASGRLAPRFKQWAWWETKKLIKSAGGESYLKLREILSSGLNRKSVRG